MSLVNELRTLMGANKQTRYIGQVARVDASRVYITVNGRTQVVNRSPGDATAYRAGDSVEVNNGALEGRRIRGKTTRVYV